MFGVWPAFSINWKCWQTWKYFRVYREILATLKIFRNHCPSFVVGYKNQKKKTQPKPLTPHPQPCLRTNPTTEFGQTMIESDYQRRVPQLPPFLDYFSISLINEPMLQNDETQPCMRRLNCWWHRLLTNWYFFLSIFLMWSSIWCSLFSFFACLVFLLWICWLWIFFFRILWVNGEFFFFPKWVKH